MKVWPMWMPVPVAPWRLKEVGGVKDVQDKDGNTIKFNTLEEAEGYAREMGWEVGETHAQREIIRTAADQPTKSESTAVRSPRPRTKRG